MEYKDLEPYIAKRQALSSALTLFSWDQETEAPDESNEQTTSYVGILSNELFQVITDSQVRNILIELQNQSLPIEQTAVVREWLKDIKRLEKIPADKYQAHQELLMKSQHVWQKAKQQNNYELFMPYLQQIVENEKEFVSYRQEDNENIYDILLNDFEPGFLSIQLDEFFKQLKEEIVPLLHEIQHSKHQIDNSFNYQSYNIQKQKDFNYCLAKYIGFDFHKGVIKESEHPFTTNFHNKDVRITTHYYENNLESAIFSTIHESGHAIYEMNIADEITMTPIGTGASMGMHESQSRFYENIIGRSSMFWKPIYPKLQETFTPQLNDVTFEHFIKAINKVETNLIRTEADELTYALHIMIRYELEKKMFEEDIDFKQLPHLWNDLYQEYLGVTPQNDSEGILQDIHWAGGDFGYFPSYAIGSAVAAQIYAYMQKNTAIDQWIEEGNFQALKDYLKEYLHQYGAIYNTHELLLQFTGEKFNPQYYINYLKNKYTKLYNLKTR